MLKLNQIIDAKNDKMWLGLRFKAETWLKGEIMPREHRSGIMIHKDVPVRTKLLKLREACDNWIQFIDHAELHGWIKEDVLDVQEPKE